MSDITIFILVITGTAIGIAFLVWLKRHNQKQAVAQNLAVDLPNVWNYTYPAEVGKPQVVSTVPVPASALTAIRNGIIKQLNTRPEWMTEYEDAGDYTVALINPHGEYKGWPSLKVKGVDGWAAGTCVGLGDGSTPPLMVLPHQQAYEWTLPDYLHDAARFESEHISLYLHGIPQPNPDVHPIFPDAEGK